MKKTLTLCIALMAIIQLLGQAPAIDWEQNYGGNNSDRGYMAIQMADGGYLIAGTAGSNNTNQVSDNHGLVDFWLAKVGATGGLQWSKCYGGSEGDYLESILLTNDGGALLFGSARSIDGDVVGNHGMLDGWVVKVSNNGTIVWKKCFGGAKDDLFYASTSTTDGGYVLVGYSESINGNLNGNHGGHDYWVVKLNSSGALQWSKNYGGDQWDDAQAIIETMDGGLMVTGSSKSNTNDVSGNHGERDIWMLKLDGLGNKLWQKSIGGSEEEVAHSIVENEDGSFIVAGYSLSDDGDASFNKGEADYWLLKLSPSADVIWEKSYGGSLHDFGFSFATSPFGGFVLVGYSESSDGDVTGNHGKYDFWVIRVDDAGNLLWKKCYGGSDGEDLRSISPTNDHGYILMGSSSSDDGDVGGNYGFYHDFWLVKLVPDVVIASNSTTNQADIQYKVFPNPASGFLQLEPHHEKIDELTIFDLTGRLIKRWEGSIPASLDVSDLQSGMYLLVAQTANSMVTKKWVKE